MKNFGLSLLCALGAALLLPLAASAAGTGSIAGTITDSGGNPISEVRVCPYPVVGEEAEPNCAITGGDGTYSVEGLSAGTYKVEFRPESIAPSYVSEFYGDTREWEAAAEVEVVEGVVTAGIDGELALGATLEGEVRAASLGGPVESVLVCARNPSKEQECSWTGPDGTYVLQGLQADQYVVEFIPASNLYNLLNQWYDHKAQPSEAELVTLSAGETRTGIDADLQAGNEVRGTVRSAATGAPLPGVIACVIFGDEYWPKECEFTDSAGRYAIGSIPSGTWRVGFSLEIGPEFFGEEPQESEDDGYLKQYYDHKNTLVMAKRMRMIAPTVKTGVDADLVADPFSTPTLAIEPSLDPTPAESRRRAQCPAGSASESTPVGPRCLVR